MHWQPCLTDVDQNPLHILRCYESHIYAFVTCVARSLTHSVPWKYIVACQAVPGYLLDMLVHQPCLVHRSTRRLKLLGLLSELVEVVFAGDPSLISGIWQYNASIKGALDHRYDARYDPCNLCTIPAQTQWQLSITTPPTGAHITHSMSYHDLRHTFDRRFDMIASGELSWLQLAPILSKIVPMQNRE